MTPEVVDNYNDYWATIFGLYGDYAIQDTPYYYLDHDGDAYCRNRRALCPMKPTCAKGECHHLLFQTDCCGYFTCKDCKACPERKNQFQCGQKWDEL